MADGSPAPGGPFVHPDLADEGTYQELACGCQFWNQGGKDGHFIYRPCSFTCQFYLYYLRTASEEGKPIEYRREL